MVLKKAMKWGKEHYPSESIQHKAAFANSVQYLVEGVSGGFGGPSLREHLASWSLGAVGTVTIDGREMTTITPGELPMPGQWEFEKACLYASQLCFTASAKHRKTLLKIMEREHCFDDDPKDLEELAGKVCLSCGKKLAPQCKGDYCRCCRHKDPSRKEAVRKARKRDQKADP